MKFPTCFWKKSSLRQFKVEHGISPIPRCSLREVSIIHADTSASNSALSWRPSTIDEWVQREARPISLKQLTYFGRSMTEDRLLSSANYVRTELPTRLAHRLRDMQVLPFAIVTNPHISHVYNLYYQAFEIFRHIKEIKSVEANDEYCSTLQRMLKEHLSVIPKLAIGILDVLHLISPEETDRFMTTLLRSRISRRVIAEQHLALTETYRASRTGLKIDECTDASKEFVGTVFLHCKAREVVEKCVKVVSDLSKKHHGPNVKIPEVRIQGHLTATFPYIVSHLEYIVGELLRNSMQAMIERSPSDDEPEPIDVLICEAPQYVIIRISDQGGGIPRNVLPHLWSFGKGPRKEARMENLRRVPKMAATLEEIIAPHEGRRDIPDTKDKIEGDSRQTLRSLTSLSYRSPNLKLGFGLPMSRIYADYWAGSLEVHNLEGYGVDAVLQIPRLGNRNEQLTTRASIDAV